MKYTIKYNQGTLVYFTYTQMICLLHSLCALNTPFTLIVEDNQS